MINTIFTDTFNFLVNSLNSLNQDDSKSKNKQNSSDALKRLIDTVQFIHSKRTTFNTDLEAVKQELMQMKKEATRLKTEFSRWTTNSLVFTIESLIDSLILEVEVEIEKRKTKIKEEQDKQSKKQTTGNTNSNQLKVKVFKSAFSDVIENEMNFFLSRNDVEIVNTLQTVEKEVVCITLFYK